MHILRYIYSKKPQFGTDDRIEKYTLNTNGGRISAYYNLDNDTTTGVEKTVDGVAMTGVDKVETYVLDSKDQVSQINYDNNVDGAVDAVDYFERDANGNIIVKYMDSDANSATGNTIEINGISVSGIDKIEAYTRNAMGYTTQIDYDNNADGETDKVKYIDLNANGQWLGEYYNNDLQGSTGYSHTVNGETVNGIDFIADYTLDANGRISYGEYDNNGDGTPSDMVVFVRNANGQVIQELRNEDGNKATGEGENGTDRIKTFTLDAEGKIVKLEQQDDPTEAVNYIEYRSYDNRNNLIEVRKDNDADGTVDVVERYTYNAKNEGIKEEFFTLEEANKTDGTPYTVKTSTRDTQTGLVLEMYTENNEKPFELIKYTYTTDGYKTEQQVYRYDEKGNIRLYNQTFYTRNASTGLTDHYYDDTDGDGDIDKASKVTHDSLGRTIMTERYVFGDTGIALSEAQNLAKEYLNQIEYNTPKVANSVQGVYYNLDPLAEETSGVTGQTIKLEDGREITGIDKYQELTLDSLSRTIVQRTVEESTNKDETRYFIRNDQGYVVKEYIDSVKNAGNTYVIRDKSVDGIDRIESILLENDGNVRLANFIDTNADGKVDQILMEQTNATLDFTSEAWTEEKFAEFGNAIQYIYISGDKATSTVVLDTNTLTQIASDKKLLHIAASWDSWPHTAEGNKADVITLKGFSESDKLADTVTKGSATYNQYVKDIDGATYTVLVDTDFTPVFS